MKKIKPKIEKSNGTEKLPELTNTHRYILDLDTFSQIQIEEILNTTESMKDVLQRPIKKVPTLRGKTIMNLFYEKDETTRIAFDLAAQALSAQVATFTHYEDSACYTPSDIARKIYGLGASIVVMRHPYAGVPYQMTSFFQGSLINAGDGNHADPSQALVDLFTIREYFDFIEKHSVVLVGDVLHSGLARSLLWGLTRMNARVTLCAPPTLLGPTQYWKTTWPNVRIEHNLDEAIGDADVIKLLPVSDACFRDGLLPSRREFRSLYALTTERIEKAKKHVLVIPSNTLDKKCELFDALSTSVQTVTEEYTTNGIAVRMALLYMLSESTL